MIETVIQTKKAIVSLIKESLKLALIGGKGGVGKTTLSCSLALSYAKDTPDKKVLLISTDPAHSISDSLEEQISSDPTPVSGFPNLKAQEIDAKKLYDSFKLENQKIIKKILERGTYFDLEDLNSFFDLSLPGIDELMALLETSRIIESNSYDLIIIDTAPAGHTLRLLELPKVMKSVIELLELMQSKHRVIVRSMTRQYNQDEADFFIRKQIRELGSLISLLRNPNHCAFIPVILPEGLSIDETKWLEGELTKLKIPIESIIVNRVIEPNDCSFRNQRAQVQQEYLKQVQTVFKNYSIYQAPLFTKQIKGKENLLTYISSIKPYTPIEVKKPSLPSSPSPLFQKSLKNGHHRMPDFITQKKDLVLFAGKGGVGKTSMALATGMYLARKHGDKKILAVSIDPAHSISSSLNTDLQGKIKDLSDNLSVLEIDSMSLLEDFRKTYLSEVTDFFENMVEEKNIKVEFDLEIIEKSLALNPPGLDELMALNKVMYIQKENNYDLIIVDSAPTGHLLRFLELPELASEWVKSFIKLLLKYHSFSQLNKTSQMLVDLSSDLRFLISKLKDPKQTELVAVTYPEAMATDETKRLLTKLKELQVNCQNIIVNMVIPKNTCEFCVSIEIDQKKALSVFTSENLIKHYKILEVPLACGEIKGISALSELGRCLYE